MTHIENDRTPLADFNRYAKKTLIELHEQGKALFREEKDTDDYRQWHLFMESISKFYTPVSHDKVVTDLSNFIHRFPQYQSSLYRVYEGIHNDTLFTDRSLHSLLFSHYLLFPLACLLTQVIFPESSLGKVYNISYDTQFIFSRIVHRYVPHLTSHLKPTERIDVHIHGNKMELICHCDDSTYHTIAFELDDFCKEYGSTEKAEIQLNGKKNNNEKIITILTSKSPRVSYSYKQPLQYALRPSLSFEEFLNKTLPHGIIPFKDRRVLLNRLYSQDVHAEKVDKFFEDLVKAFSRKEYGEISYEHFSDAYDPHISTIAELAKLYCISNSAEYRGISLSIEPFLKKIFFSYSSPTSSQPFTAHALSQFFFRPYKLQISDYRSRKGFVYWSTPKKDVYELDIICQELCAVFGNKGISYHVTPSHVERKMKK